MDYLSLRDHAAGELYQKLCRKFDAHSAAYAVARAGELGLLNDVSFARRRAAELLRKRKSRRAILDDLHAKGIDRGTPPKRWKLYSPKARRTRRKPGAGQCPCTWWNAIMPQSWHRQMAAGSCRFGTARVLPQRDPPGIGRCRDRRNRSVTQKSTHRRGKKMLLRPL